MDSIEFRLRPGWIGRLLRYVGKRGIHDNGLDSFFFFRLGIREYKRYPFFLCLC